MTVRAATGGRVAQHRRVIHGQLRKDLYGDPLPPGAIARIGTTRLWYGSQVYALAYTPEGKALIGSGMDETVWLWDTTTGKNWLVSRVVGLTPSLSPRTVGSSQQGPSKRT
jgi:WD40 repeat protein